LYLREDNVSSAKQGGGERRGGDAAEDIMELIDSFSLR